MTQRSRSRQTNASGSKSKESRADLDFFPTLLYDDLESTRNSVGLVHPFVLESLFEDTRGASKPPNRKTTSTTPRKSSKSTGASRNEEPKRGATLSTPKSLFDQFFEEEYVPDYLLEESSASNKTPNKSKSKAINSDPKSRKSSKNPDTSRNEELKRGATSSRPKNLFDQFFEEDDIPDYLLVSEEPSTSTKTPSKSKSKTTTKAKKQDEVLPTRELRSTRKYAEFKRELQSVSDFSIENMDWYYEDESYYKKKCNTILSDFAIPRDRLLEGSYTYLLLDPRLCGNKRNISWFDFIDAIFYIGKGKNKRAFQHAKEAEALLAGGSNSKKCLMIKKIWDSGHPIKVFFATENIVDEEARTREAAMIEAMGLRRLCNKIRGSYYGVAATLKARECLELGATLLMEARDSFRWKEAIDVYPEKKSLGRPNFSRNELYCEY